MSESKQWSKIGTRSGFVYIETTQTQKLTLEHNAKCQ